MKSTTLKTIQTLVRGTAGVEFRCSCVTEDSIVIFPLSRNILKDLVTVVLRYF